MRGIAFAKRNIKEYLRNPLTLFFTLGFPIIMFIVFQVIKIGTGLTDDIAPMFTAKSLTPSISVFSFTFVGLTLSLQISRDRSLAFFDRLRVTPMTGLDFFVGYFLPCLIIAIVQCLLAFAVGFIFGLPLSLGVLYAFLILIVISVFYISLGVLVGSLFSEKSCGGICSILVNLTALMSGMFFPLSEGTFKTVLTCFPFLPSTALPQAFIYNDYSNLLTYGLVLIGYSALTITASILVFRKRLQVK